MEGYLIHSAILAFVILSLFNDISPCRATQLPHCNGTTEFIRNSCKTTLYSKLCFSSLKNHACNIQNDPKLLAYTALNVTLEFAMQSHEEVKKYSEIRLKPVLAATMLECVNELSLAMEKIARSEDELDDKVGKGSDPKIETDDTPEWVTQAWLSAGLRTEKKCIYGFTSHNLHGKLETITRRKIMKVTHMTRNALALLNHYVDSTVEKA